MCKRHIKQSVQCSGLTNKKKCCLIMAHVWLKHVATRNKMYKFNDILKYLTIIFSVLNVFLVSFKSYCCIIDGILTI
jgi:hypothetical protein